MIDDFVGALGASSLATHWTRASFDAVWPNPVEGEKNITWARAACSTMGKFTGSGAYVNFPGLGEEGETLVQAAYGGNYARLVELKNQSFASTLVHGITPPRRVG